MRQVRIRGFRPRTTARVAEELQEFVGSTALCFASGDHVPLAVMRLDFAPNLQRQITVPGGLARGPFVLLRKRLSCRLLQALGRQLLHNRHEDLHSFGSGGKDRMGVGSWKIVGYRLAGPGRF